MTLPAEVVQEFRLKKGMPGAPRHSLVTNPPGNKRVGAMAAELVLAANGLVLTAADAELTDRTPAAAQGSLTASHRRLDPPTDARASAASPSTTG